MPKKGTIQARVSDQEHTPFATLGKRLRPKQELEVTPEEFGVRGLDET
jgi:hypothetical protein